MRRTLLGILALVFLMTAGGIFLRGLAHESTLALSVCLRMGLVLGAMWLAYEQVHEIIRRTPPWVMGGAALGLLVVVVRPRAIIAVGPLLVSAAALYGLGKFLKPVQRSKKKNSPSRPPEDRSD
ncbi:MAG: hypothetical protein GXP28_04035 [Planctomycetes bacterium]|nr:hypothetical protein [Planctomycetota bacterium]